MSVAAAAPAAPATPAAPAAPARHSLHGRVELAGKGAFAPVAGEAAATVVYFVPERGGARPRPGRFSIYTQGKAFDPPHLVVPVGSTIAFPNNDPIRHNVFSATPGAAFDLGFYGEGESRERVFEQPGVVVVNCNVHHVMQAEVLVVPSVHQARVDAGGRFQLDGLPPGRGTLYLWHPRAGLQSLPLAIPAGQPVERRLALVRAR